MKTTLNVFKILIITLFLTSCSGNDDSNSGGSGNFGTIQLSGPDTATLGSSLTVGNIDPVRLDTTGTTSCAAENTDCGSGFSVDKVVKQIVFDDTIVIHVDSEAILTMNGTINY